MRRIFFLLMILPITVYSQTGVNGNNILERLGQTARSYLLSANRPSFGVTSGITEKGKIGLGLYGSFNQDVSNVSVSMSYGVSNKTEVFGGFDPLTQSYQFNGTKTSGFGDSHAGVKYMFHESNYFEHVVQLTVKIPTAQKETNLGTGFADFHIGVGQGYYNNNFSYDFGVDFAMLKRREAINKVTYPAILRAAIDSVNAIYDIAYEKELTFSFSPGYNLSERVSVYTGIDLSRNFSLDYTTSGVYFGLGYAPANRFSIGVGGSVGILNSEGFTGSGGVSFLF